MGRQDWESETLIPTLGGHFDVANTLQRHHGNPQLDQTMIPIQNATRGKDQNGIGIAENGDPMYTIDQASQHAIAFGWQNSAQQGASASASHTPTLDKSKVPAVAIGWNGDTTPKTGIELSPTLRREQGGEGVGVGMMVRRLTPTECERLQGFPDGYTQVPYRGKPASDGPRYKALGNSMAVPVMRWIGDRIAMVNAVTEKQ
jgi:DNA (cytosine-5)-methyltransferase 1